MSIKYLLLIATFCTINISFANNHSNLSTPWGGQYASLAEKEAAEKQRAKRNQLLEHRQSQIERADSPRERARARSENHAYLYTGDLSTPWGGRYVSLAEKNQAEQQGIQRNRSISNQRSLYELNNVQQQNAHARSAAQGSNHSLGVSSQLKPLDVGAISLSQIVTTEAGGCPISFKTIKAEDRVFGHKDVTSGKYHVWVDNSENGSKVLHEMNRNKANFADKNTCPQCRKKLKTGGSKNQSNIYISGTVVLDIDKNNEMHQASDRSHYSAQTTQASDASFFSEDENSIIPTKKIKRKTWDQAKQERLAQEIHQGKKSSAKPRLTWVQKNQNELIKSIDEGKKALNQNAVIPKYKVSDKFKNYQARWHQRDESAQALKNAIEDAEKIFSQNNDKNFGDLGDTDKIMLFKNKKMYISQSTIDLNKLLQVDIEKGNELNALQQKIQDASHAIQKL